LVHAGWETFLTAFLGTTMAPLWPNDQKCDQAITTSIDEASGRNIAQTSSAVNHPGTDATSGTISQRSATVVGLRDGAPTRAGRGRMYWPPVAGSKLDAQGLITSANATLIANGFKAAVDGLDVADQLVIYHRPVKAGDLGIPPAKSGSITPVLRVTVGTIVGTQRRRTNRVQQAYTSVGV
jgi:hypothetical protein